MSHSFFSSSNCHTGSFVCKLLLKWRRCFFLCIGLSSDVLYFEIGETIRMCHCFLLDLLFVASLISVAISLLCMWVEQVFESQLVCLEISFFFLFVLSMFSWIFCLHRRMKNTYQLRSQEYTAQYCLLTYTWKTLYTLLKFSLI